MAITKVLHMQQAKSGYKAKHLANGLKYIMDPKKTSGGCYISGSGCVPENALSQMLETKRHFGKLDKRQAYHFIISFEEGEVTEEEAFQIMREFTEEYLGDGFEAVYTVHNDTAHIHGHLIFNSVRCTDGQKYDYPKGEWEHRIQPLVNRLCKEYGLSTLDMEKVKTKRGQKKSGGKEEEYVDNLPEPTHISQMYVDKPQVQQAEILYIFIPYRNRHLTRHQRECFYRKYRTGKIHKNPRTQEYKASCQALKRLQEEYLFWVEQGIRNRGDIHRALEKAEEYLKNIRSRKKEIIQERGQYQTVFSLLKALEGWEMEAGLYQEGYPEFAGAYQEYQKICGQLAGLGFSLDEARKLEQYFITQWSGLEKMRKAALKERRIAKRLEAKACGQEQNLKEQKGQEHMEEDQNKRSRKDENRSEKRGMNR